uniref:Cna B-type domain-containing protein n=1 Tax=Peptostreptococcus russellii TaxID=215200 RepID=UPI0026F082F3
MRKIFSLLISLIMIFNFVILDVTQAVERTEQLNSSVSSVQEEVIETDTENKNVTEESIDEKTSDDITINKEESSSQSLQDNQEIEASVGGNIEKELDSNKLNVIDLVVPYMKSLVTPYSMFYGSNIITNLSVSPVDIGHTGDIKVSVDFAGQTEDPSRDDYIQVGQRITIPISAESGAYVKLKSQIPEIKGLKITADSNEIVIEFTEEIKNQYGVKGNVHITYSGINQDEGTTKVVSIGGKEVSITNRIGGDVGVFAGKAGMMYGESNPGYVTWFLRGNINGENWPGGPLIINDKLGEGQELDGNGIEIALYWGGQQHKTYEMIFDSIEDFLNNADYGRSKGSKIEYNKVNGTIDINIPEEVLRGKEFSFKYDAKITDVDLEKYTNDADFKFYEKGEPDTINETAEVTNIDQGGYITGKTRAWLNINKVLGEEEKPLAGVKFKVTREDGGTLYEGREEKEAVFTTNEEGQIRESGFKPGKLILTEIYAPLFVSFNPQEKRILDLKANNRDEEHKISNDVKKTNVKVIKNWVGVNESDIKGKQVSVKLLKNGVLERTETLNEANSWQYTFENLPKYDGQGKEISYDVEEVKQEGYSTRKSGSVENGFIITNTKEGKASFDVKKNWVGPIGKTAEIKLLKNGELEKTVTLNEANNWQYRFEDLPKYDVEGKEISYDVEEIEQEGYSTTKSGSVDKGFVITNTKKGKLSIGVTKNWIGTAGEKAEIKLLKNGTVERTEILNEANNWQYTFEDLPKYDVEGKEISYDVEEVEQEGYSTRKSGSVENGFVITNTKEGKVSFDVKKNWVGPIGKTAEI